MKRRKFLQRIPTGLGAILLPTMLTNCEKEAFLGPTDFAEKVIIIGAGVAGLYAGYLLQEKGIDFTILEASDRLGGRMGKETNFADFPIDTGAQWLHGDFSILGDLVKVTGTETFLDESETYYWYRGTLISELPAEVQTILDEVEERTEDISYEDYFYNAGGTSEDRGLIVSAAGDVGASPDRISVKWENEGYNLISYGSDDHLFRKTYFDLINDYIAAPIREHIQLATPVTAIDYSSTSVRVTAADGEVYIGAKVIVTVPLTILQDGDITFTPNLPQHKRQSFQALGMEAGTKAFLRFSNKFTSANIMGGTTCAAYALSSYGRNTEDLVLMGFLMGNQARALSDLGEAATLQALLEELDTMFDGQASASYLDHFFQDWYREPYIRGAYSYPLVGSNENTRRYLAESVDNKLFFAGEATNTNGHHQTVHGAVETAYREVINLLS